VKKILRNLTECTIVLGLDVDSQAVQVTALEVSTGSLEFEGRLNYDPATWKKFIERFQGSRIIAYHEAGNIGFGFCRMLRKLGVDCQVVAPSAVPKSPTQRQIKNDRRDALALTQTFFHPPRSFVRVPTEQEEADRQLIRTRFQLANDRTRTMARIKSELLNYGLRPVAGMVKGSWSKAFRQWLRHSGASEMVQFTLEVHLRQLEQTEVSIKALNARIAELSRSEAYHDRCQRLLQICGVGTLTAMAFLTEVFRPEEFANAQRLAAHLGLTQSEYSSAGHIRRGHITHWGPPHLRRLLVEASWVWISKDAAARKRYLEIRSGKERKIAIVAMARRLAIAMWAMTVKGERYKYQWVTLPEAA
jgi:transposase